MKYDVFISYRREGGRDFARLIQQSLRICGYRVFFDYDSLQDGVFNSQIFKAIEVAPIFIIVLSKGSMQRCVNNGDWVAQEIEYALKHNKKIVPVNIDGLFDGFPSQLREDGCIGSLIGSIQYTKLDMGELFDDSMERLIERRIAPTVQPRRYAAKSDVDSGARIRIRPDIDCVVSKFDEEVATLKGGTFNVLRLMRGRHLLKFTSTSCDEDYYEFTYEVADNDMEDFFDVELIPTRDARLKIMAEAEELKRKQEEDLAMRRANNLKRRQEAEEAKRKAEEKKRIREEAETMRKNREQKRIQDAKELREAERQKEEMKAFWEAEKERERIANLPPKVFTAEIYNSMGSPTYLVIPNSYTSIGYAALNGCTNLVSVLISNSVKTIEGWAFYRCTKLTSINIPNSVTTIGVNIFAMCENLSTITISNSIKSIAACAFSDCTSLTNVTIPDSVTSIGAKSFRNCTSLTSITIPNSVTHIGSCAFSGCKNLKVINLPNTLTYVGSDAFKTGSGTFKINIPNADENLKQMILNSSNLNIHKN